MNSLKNKLTEEEVRELLKHVCLYARHRNPYIKKANPVVVAEEAIYYLKEMGYIKQDKAKQDYYRLRSNFFKYNDREAIIVHIVELRETIANLEERIKGKD